MFLPKKAEKWYGYVLEYKADGETKTREGFGKIEGTYHQAVLMVPNSKPWKDFWESCEVHVHTENEFILNMIDTISRNGQGMSFRIVKESLWQTKKNGWKFGDYPINNDSLPSMEIYEYASWLESAIRREKEKGEIGTEK